MFVDSLGTRSRAVRRSRATLAGFVLAVLATPSDGARARNDWPGLWGPDRSASVPGPLPIGPETELQEVWRRPLGKGYSEVVVAAGHGYTVFTDGETDQLIALDFATGETIWRAEMEATHRGLMGSDDGPLSSPLVDGRRVFVLDPFGRLFAFDAATGSELWRRDLAAEFGALRPAYGFATSPLAVGESLVVQAGGPEHNIVALEQATGATIWSSHPAQTNGTASPVLTTFATRPQIVGVTTDRIFGLDPASGAPLWTHPLSGGPLKGPTIVSHDRLVVSSWVDTVLLKVEQKEDEFQVAELWRTPTLKANYSPVVYRRGHLYGMDRTYLTCLDVESGAVRWKHKVYEATLILVGDHLAVLGQKSGIFQIVEASHEGFREVLRATVFTPGARTVTGPTFVDGRFLLRNGEEMVELELRDRGAPVDTPSAEPGGEP